MDPDHATASLVDATSIDVVPDQGPLRLGREELRDLLLEAGRELLHIEGMATASTNLTFARVFGHVESKTGRRVTNASVIRRIWENQAEYQADVLVSLAHDQQRPEIDQTLQALGTVLKEVDLQSADSRRRALQELCRVGGGASTRAIAASPYWSLWISIHAIATTSSQADQRQRLVAAVSESYDSVTDFWMANYRLLTEYLGFRVRAPRTLRQFTITVTALTDGLSLRQHVDGEIYEVALPTGASHEDQVWTIFACGLAALVEQFFEPDPAFGAR